jgi:hypothetical protein
MSSSPAASSTAAVSFSAISPEKSEFHPALFVTNIKISISFVLEMKKDRYIMWAELFEAHARAHKIIDHIIPQSGKEIPVTTS